MNSSIRLVAVALVSAPLWAVAAPAYVAHALTDPQGRMLKGDAINAAGDVAGATNAVSQEGPIEAMVRGPGFFRHGRVGGSSNSEANAIDAAGEVAGFSQQHGRSRAFVSDGGPAVWLFEETFASNATAMSPSGLVAGYGNSDGDVPQAFLRQGGNVTWLGALLPQGASYAWGVNDDGAVVGQASAEGGLTWHAFRWQGGTMTDLGNLHGRPGFSTALAVNAEGTAVGRCELRTNLDHACAWTPDGHAVDLGALAGGSSWAAAIDGAGEIVGASSAAGFSGTHAVLFRRDEVADLNELVELPAGVALTSASAINDRGQIVVRGVGPDGLARNFVLDPVAAR